MAVHSTHPAPRGQPILDAYLPNRTEWMISAGIWAFGLMICTVALKVALPIFTGEMTLAPRRARR